MAGRMNPTVTRFFAMFDGAPPQPVADKLGITTKTLKRLRDGENQPTEQTLGKMLELMNSIDQEVLGTEEERLARAESLRANYEKQQRELKLSQYQDKFEKKYPRWFLRAHASISEERDSEAIEAISDHVLDKEAWTHVDQSAKSYILHALGVAYYRTGRHLEAYEASDDALKELTSGGKNYTSTLLHAWILVIKGLSAMRLWNTNEAFALFEQARLVDPSVDGVYYNGLCCASLLKAEDQVGFWTGLYVASSHLFSVEDINDVLSRIKVDKDLVFFRTLPIMKEFEDRLIREVSSRTQEKEP
ncbi:helix-turn-helix domain-containing protein [Sinorhizobium alkalisoli]|uniref:HTH cro/C1-type domain-containing protein n=1 Tax=Sinorhizobium alkalisoli TaxID=1752398 RepID=A0A1E3VI63_9HYPH|nr:hypothetical protein [Sinorhizobium alkalisoli]ODR93234.1 hypothetical protein A8M32_00730 [Sinorhizobium alkalisoli]